MTTTLAPARTTAPTTPAPRPAVPMPTPPTAAMCGACNGQGGAWITNDGQTPGKSFQQWVPCKPCGGTGEK